MNLFLCERYNCKMTVAACEKRQELANNKRSAEGTIYRDAGCQNCKQERTIMEPEIKKICNKCGAEKPRKAYSPNKDCKHGVEGTCRECKQKAKLERQKRNFVDQKPRIDEPQKKKPSTDEPQQLVINFKEYPDIFSDIVKAAKDEFRTPEMQILFMVSKQIGCVNHAAPVNP